MNIKKSVNTQSSNQGQVDLTKLQSSFEKSKNDFNNIPNEVGHSAIGMHEGNLCEHLPIWAQEQGLKRGMVHNRFKTIQVQNDMGYTHEKEVFDGFYIYAYMGKDSNGRGIKDQLCFYDEKYDGQNGTETMTFENAIANIEQAAKKGIEPVGPARKLWAIAMENGFNHPLQMLISEVDKATGEVTYNSIKYAQKKKKFTRNSGRGYWERRICVSASLYEHNIKNAKSFQSKNGKSSSSINNNVANHYQQSWSKALRLDK